MSLRCTPGQRPDPVCPTPPTPVVPTPLLRAHVNLPLLRHEQSSDPHTLTPAFLSAFGVTKVSSLDSPTTRVKDFTFKTPTPFLSPTTIFGLYIGTIETLRVTYGVTRTVLLSTLTTLQPPSPETPGGSYLFS